MVRSRDAEEGRSHWGEGHTEDCADSLNLSAARPPPAQQWTKQHRRGLPRPRHRTGWLWISLISSSSHPRQAANLSELWVFSC